MISKYGIFCKVIEYGSFTKVASMYGYSQSAISQTIKSLEREIGHILIERKKDGICLTSDGEQFLPYIRAIYSSEENLWKKQNEVRGLENSTIKIGTFTSVSRNILPALMKKFNSIYPTVSFVLRQGEYTSIEKWVKEGTVDFGFVNTDIVTDLETRVLYQDHMLAILPPDHILADLKQIPLERLTREPFILLDEGDYSVPLASFKENNLYPEIVYEVYDDYTILAMVKQGLGVSLVYEMLLAGYHYDLIAKPVAENLKRTVGLAWKNWDTLSYAARTFIKFICEELHKDI